MAAMPSRLAEIGFLGGSHAMASGWTSPYLSHHPIYTGAAEAAQALRSGWKTLCVLGPPGPDRPVTFFVGARRTCTATRPAGPILSGC